MPRFCTASTDGSAALVFCLFFRGSGVRGPPRTKRNGFLCRKCSIIQMTIPRVLRGIPLLVYIKGGEGGASIFRSFSRHVVKERRGWLFNATAWKGPKITGPFWFNETIDLTAFVPSLVRWSNMITCIWARILILCEEAGKRNILRLRILLVQG